VIGDDAPTQTDGAQTDGAQADVGEHQSFDTSVEPGVTRIQHWRPDSELEEKAPAALWGGVGRKP